jgi:hypothetical protein
MPLIVRQMGVPVQGDDRAEHTPYYCAMAGRWQMVDCVTVCNGTVIKSSILGFMQLCTVVCKRHKVVIKIEGRIIMVEQVGVRIQPPYKNYGKTQVSPGWIEVTAKTADEAEKQLRDILKKQNIGSIGPDGKLNTNTPDRGIITRSTPEHKGMPFARFLQGTTYMKQNLNPTYPELQRESRGLNAEEDYAGRKQTWNSQTGNVEFGPANITRQYSTFWEER